MLRPIARFVGPIIRRFWRVALAAALIGTAVASSSLAPWSARAPSVPTPIAVEVPPTADEEIRELAPVVAVILRGGFEEPSLDAGGWVLDVDGDASVAEAVAAPVWRGRGAARFATTTQAQGERAFAERRLSWPASDFVAARAMFLIRGIGTQFSSKVFALETHGPNNWVTRAGYALSSRGFEAIYTTRDGTLESSRIDYPARPDLWYELEIIVDYQDEDPTMRFAIDGQEVYRFTDTTEGSHTDRPTGLRVGFGPGVWGNNRGSVIVDDIVVRDGPTASPLPGTLSSLPALWGNQVGLA